MSLPSGRRLGPYEVVSPLGAGGMGEVYRARDTRLGRDVALKVLPRALAGDPQRRQRLEREARAISALSHPHVCALFDVGRAELEDGPLEYLVMELLEGETLAQRLERGPLPLAQVVSLGAQIAEALGAAHRLGIVHRDLKPGNVMLTRSGTKLLDFGLARLGESEAQEVPLATAVTESNPLTRAGTVVGTWPYMAPEQLSGRTADARSDVFALGAVLFEMLTARRAFPGATMAEVSAAILKEETPDPRAHAPAVPSAVAAVVRKCLEKDPAGRWQSADDVGAALRLVGEARAGEAAAPTTSGSARRWQALAAALGIAAAVAGGALLLRPAAPPPELLRFAVPPPAGTLLPRPTMGLPLAAVPDGRRAVLLASAGGVNSLWLWSAQSGAVRRLEGTEGAVSPFFSPAGDEVAFFAAEELRRVSIAGGLPTRVAEAPSGHSGTWGADGTILFLRWYGPEAGLWSVPARGGEPRRLQVPTSLQDSHTFPFFLPDSRHYLFLKSGRPGSRKVCVGATSGGEPDCVAECDSVAQYAGTGHIVCVRRGALVAHPFDPKTLRTTGEAVTLVPDVRWFGPPGSASFAVSASGRLLVWEPAPRPSRLVWLDRSGRELGRLGEAARYGQLGLTRDGRRLVVETWSQDTGGRDLWSLDVASGVSNRLTFEPFEANSPVWSPDGQSIAFGRVTGEPPDVGVRSLDGSRVETILELPGVQFPRHWSPDGRLIAYEDYMTSRRDQRQTWLVSLDGQHRRFHEVPASVYHPRFSPDSRTLAFVSEESGRPEVYVAAVDGGGLPRRLSRAGGLLPRFRADGRELYFFQPDGMMVAVDPGLEAPPPRLLFHVEGVIAFDFDYDVAPDGQRFLVRIAAQPEGSTGLRLALDWVRGSMGTGLAGSTE